MKSDPKYPCDNGCDCECDFDAEAENTEAMRRVDIESAVNEMLDNIAEDWEAVHRDVSSETERW